MQKTNNQTSQKEIKKETKLSPALQYEGFQDYLKKDIDIFYRIWDKVESPKGVVQIFHGMVEHIERYGDLARFLNENGYIVAGINMRGHGLTGRFQGRMGHFADKDGWNKIYQDQKDFHNYLLEKYELPMFLIGHSMGSFLARYYINLNPKDFSKVIIMSTGKADDKKYSMGSKLFYLLDLKKDSMLLHTMAFGSYSKSAGLRAGRYDWISTDKDQVNFYKNDEYCGHKVSNRFYYDFIHGMEEVSKLEKILPFEGNVLFLAGDKDPVGDKGNFVKYVYKKYKDFANASIKIYKGMRHEILNEVGNQEVYRDILTYFDTGLL